MIGLVCGLLSNLCFAVRNVITPSSPAAAADSDALFLAINVIAAGKVFAAALVFAICTANLLLFLSAHPALTAALVSLWAALSRLLLSPSLARQNDPIVPAGPAALQSLLLCGACHFMYNYSSFAFLAATSPISHSVANCLRRIFVIALSLLYFRNQVSSLAVFGTLIALAGVWLFTHVKNECSAARSSLLPITEEIKAS
jgi:hypothetical protein